jgi:hypothetical protein
MVKLEMLMDKLTDILRKFDFIETFEEQIVDKELNYWR